MNDPIILALIAIVPPVLSAVLTYKLTTRKLKIDSDAKIKIEFGKLSDSLRTELKKELDECRKDRETLRNELNDYKKKLDTYKKENETLKKEMADLEIKLDSSNEVIKTLVTNNKKKVKV